MWPDYGKPQRSKRLSWQIFILVKDIWCHNLCLHIIYTPPTFEQNIDRKEEWTFIPSQKYFVKQILLWVINHITCTLAYHLPMTYTLLVQTCGKQWQNAKAGYDIQLNEEKTSKLMDTSIYNIKTEAHCFL